MPVSVLILWWITLGLFVVLVLPLALYLLNRAFRSADDIRDYTEETLAAAQGIAHNLEAVQELRRTPELAPRVREATAALAAEASALERPQDHGGEA